MIDDLFPNAPFDFEPGMKPNYDRVKQVFNWFKDNASVIGLAIAIGVIL